MEDKKQTVVLDFDGVIHSYISGWHGPTVVRDNPVPGIKKAIEDIRREYKVVVVSARCNQVGGTQAIKEYLHKHGIRVDGIASEKPPAVVYVDGQAITFDGDSYTLLDKIKSFKPWNAPIDGTVKKG